MSDTPRTEIYVLDPLPQVVSADWARQLERELSAAKARIARLQEALENVINAGKPNQREHPSMWKAWQTARLVMEAKESKP